MNRREALKTIAATAAAAVSPIPSFGDGVIPFERLPYSPTVGQKISVLAGNRTIGVECLTEGKATRLWMAGVYDDVDLEKLNSVGDYVAVGFGGTTKPKRIVMNVVDVGEDGSASLAHDDGSTFLYVKAKRSGESSIRLDCFAAYGRSSCDMTSITSPAEYCDYLPSMYGNFPRWVFTDATSSAAQARD